MSQRDWELNFWKSEVSKGYDAFMAQRRADWEEHLRHFPELNSPYGEILEVGTGLVSVFEFSPKKCVSIDPLNDEYDAILKPNDRGVTYRTSWEGIGQDSFDEVLCVNVIDHTPEPEDLLGKIRATLRPQGKLYFEVNFDGSLSPAHYSLWDKAKVDSFMQGWTLLREGSEPNPAYNQVRYWAVYVCEKPASSSPATSSTKKSTDTKKDASTPSSPRRRGRPPKSSSSTTARNTEAKG